MFAPQDALPLPGLPNLDQYKKLAKELARAANSADPSALRAWITHWIDSLAKLSNLILTPQLPVRLEHWIDQLDRFARAEESGTKLTLTKSQFILARAHGFESWTKFARHIESVSRVNTSTSNFEQAVDAIITGDLKKLAALLHKNSKLIHARSTRQHRATLLHYIGANGVEGYRQKTPPNSVEIAKLLLDAGADVNAIADIYGGGATTLALVATSIHPEQAGLQESLLDHLLEHGAPLDASVINSCLANGRIRAAEFLAARGAPLDLESAAGLGRIDEVKKYFDQKGTLAANASRAKSRSRISLGRGIRPQRSSRISSTLRRRRRRPSQHRTDRAPLGCHRSATRHYQSAPRPCSESRSQKFLRRHRARPSHLVSRSRE